MTLHRSRTPEPTCPRLIDSRPVCIALTELRERQKTLEEMMPGQAQTQILSWCVSRVEQALGESSRSSAQYLSTSEAAQMLGLSSAQAITQRARNNKVPGARREAGKWLIPRSYVDAELNPTQVRKAA